ncbi:MAG: HAD-IA family hydrolase [Pseudomonadota bacterium]
MRCVIFDLDGTLADTSRDLLEAANATFDELGFPVTLGPGDAGVALRGGRAMLTLGMARLGAEEAVAQDVIDRGYRLLLEHYSEAISVQTRFYPGAIEAVERCRSRGERVAICTNKPERLAEKLMADLGARDLFDALLGSDSLPVRKPDPVHLFETIDRAGGQRDRACLVGDSDTDRDTARAAGVPSILVTFGPSGADMAALEPEALLTDYADLDAVLDRVLPIG